MNGKRASALETADGRLGQFLHACGGTGGTLIGLIFVVITLGIDHAKKGDELRGRLYVTPILVYFTSLLVIAMVMVPPMPDMARALSLGVIGCAGLAYVMNLDVAVAGQRRSPRRKLNRRP